MRASWSVSSACCNSSFNFLFCALVFSISSRYFFSYSENSSFRDTLGFFSSNSCSMDSEDHPFGNDFCERAASAVFASISRLESSYS